MRSGRSEPRATNAREGLRLRSRRAKAVAIARVRPTCAKTSICGTGVCGDITFSHFRDLGVFWVFL